MTPTIGMCSNNLYMFEFAYSLKEMFTQIKNIW